MSDATATQVREAFVSNAMEATIRIGLMLLVAAWCFQIVRPFVAPVAWGLIIAVSTRPLYKRLEAALGGRAGLAATAFAVIGLLVIVGPVLSLSTTVVDGAHELSQLLGDEGVHVPPPPEGVKSVPVVGDSIYRSWSLANTNLAAALASVESQIRGLAGWLLGAAASAGLGVLLFAAAIVVAAVFHTNAEAGQRFANSLATRVAGDRGVELASLAESTVRGVTKGILGVALIQALAAGVGMVAVGVPGAGLWALLVLVLAVVQLPPLLVLLPVAIYVFQVESTWVAVVFGVWAVLVSLSDSVLKPVLLARGVDVPMPIIFVGAIGGFASTGIIGLFVGAIVLSVGYQLFVAWLEPAEAEASQASA